MDLRMIGKYLGYLVWVEALFLLPAVAVGLIYWERSAAWLLLTAAICAFVGLVLFVLCNRANGTIYAREGFVVAGGGWLLISLLGALPFWLSGEIPGFIDALFESVSGFTTTGGSILGEVESMSRGLLFWRCFTNWLGGIGVLVFILAVVRAKQGAGFTMHLLRAESAGPQVGKLRAKTRDSVRVLFGVYLALSALNLMLLLVGGMPLFDALCTMFSTAGTGGFGVKNDSMAGYSLYLQAVTGVFMALFAVNLTLYWLLACREWKAVWRDSELRLFLGILLGAVAAICVSLTLFGGVPFPRSLHEAGFTASSVMSSTGNSITNYDLWPEFSRAVLLCLMIVGGMAGSTAGGFKVARVLILLKSAKAGLHKLLHPRSVKAVKVNGKTITGDVMRGTNLYLTVYCMISILSLLLISVDGFSLETNLSAVAATLNNIGPGLGAVGPTQSFAGFSVFSKAVLVFNMLVGRLEIFPILLLLSPVTWRRKA